LDTITHGLIGASLSKAGFYQRFGRTAILASTLGAVFPDFDIVASLFGPEFSLRYHRGITHSLVCAPFFAMVLALFIYRFSSLKRFPFIVLMVALGIYSHIFFDLLTSYGTMVFAPLSVKRYSLNLVFILDPFITVPVLLGLVVGSYRKELAFRVSVSLFLFLFLYLLVCSYAKGVALKKLKEFSSGMQVEVVRSSIYPGMLAPVFWMGVVETRDAFYKFDIDIYRGEARVFKRFGKIQDNQFTEIARQLRVTKVYLWFADFPVMQYRNENGKHVVEFFDLRFGMIPDRIPFKLEVIFSRNGSLERVFLNGRLVKRQG